MTRDTEIRQVGIKGKRIRTAHLDIRILASPLRHPRAGFIVPKYSHSAVERNRLKRRLREIVRTEVLGALGSFDVVIRAKPNAYTARFETLAAELRASTSDARRSVP